MFCVNRLDSRGAQDTNLWKSEFKAVENSPETYTVLVTLGSLQDETWRNGAGGLMCDKVHVKLQNSKC